MTAIFLPNKIDNIIYQFKKRAVKSLKAQDKKFFAKHFDSYIEWLGEEKKDFAESVEKLTKYAGPILVNNMLEMFKIREEENNAEMGCTIDDNDGDGKRDPTVSSMGGSGSGPDNGDTVAASSSAL